MSATTLTIAPPLPSIQRGSTPATSGSSPVMLLRTTAFQPLSEMSLSGAGNWPPALLTSPSIRPCALEHGVDGRLHRLLLADVAGVKRRRRAAILVISAATALELLAACGRPAPRAAPSDGQLVRGAAPDAAAAAGDDDALAVERAWPEHRTILHGMPLVLPMILGGPVRRESDPGTEGEGRTILHSPFYVSAHEAFRDQVRRFVRTEIEPHVDEWDEAEAFPRELHRKAAQVGLLQLDHPEELGGGSRPSVFRQRLRWF